MASFSPALGPTSATSASFGEGKLPGASGSATNYIAEYPFTSDYLDTINGYAANFAADPTIGATGIVVVGATTQASVDTTGWPVNDFSMSFKVEGFNSNPATAIVVERNSLGGLSETFYLARISGGFTLAMQTTAGLFSIASSAVADVTSATGYEFLVEKRTTGCRLSIDEIGGSSIVDSTDTGANAQADLSAWTAFPQEVMDMVAPL
jgi:hypothetical protein